MKSNKKKCKGIYIAIWSIVIITIVVLTVFFFSVINQKLQEMKIEKNIPQQENQTNPPEDMPNLIEQNNSSDEVDNSAEKIPDLIDGGDSFDEEDDTPDLM